MLVDVVELRRRGVRLSAEDVRAIPFVRGLLRLQVQHTAWYSRKDRVPLIALLLDEHGAPVSMLPSVYNARVVEICARGMLIIGTQEEQRRRPQEHRQAWWVLPAGVQSDSTRRILAAPGGLDDADPDPGRQP